ncbi:PREDICTED: uncharacterized protein LOC108576113 [Habropoda laboriosa]|uniref:uncharacterized protein LOC108576113 n=1 Tax=Habropoda laboriosa TaxID=597456 RepID=UPI00083E0126|nr:PREDICTED: uncharacterized protein LOC108576113 [Habropoda laboriosa]
MPCVDYCVRVDLRTVSFDVPPQEVLTKDSVTVSVDAVVYYRIKEPLNAVVKIANYRSDPAPAFIIPMYPTTQLPDIIMTWNGCFLRSKTLELEMFMLTNNIIIATIQETWLSPKTDVTLSGYHIERRREEGESSDSEHRTSRRDSKESTSATSKLPKKGQRIAGSEAAGQPSKPGNPRESLESLKVHRKELEAFLMDEANNIELSSDVRSRRESELVHKRETSSHRDKQELRRNAPLAPKTPKRECKKSQVVIIKPAISDSKDTSESVKEKIFEVLKENKKDLRIKQVRKIRNNGVLIEAGGEDDLKIIKEAKFAKLGLKCEAPKMLNPCVIIYDVDQQMKEDEIRQEIWGKNLKDSALAREVYDTLLHFRFSTKNKTPGLVNWVIELPVAVLKELEKRKKLYIGWQVHSVKEFMNVSRCFKCLGFGHSTKKCEVTQQVCEHCAQAGHLRQDCPASKAAPKCICCTRAKRRSTDHSARDRNCPEYLRQVEILRSKITYAI